MREFSIRAALTFAEVWLAIVIGGNVLSGTEAFDSAAALSVLEAASLGATGALLSVLLNGVIELRKRN